MRSRSFEARLGKLEQKQELVQRERARNPFPAWFGSKVGGAEDASMGTGPAVQPEPTDAADRAVADTLLSLIVIATTDISARPLILFRSARGGRNVTETPASKRCRGCGLVKPATDFPC